MAAPRSQTLVLALLSLSLSFSPLFRLSLFLFFLFILSDKPESISKFVARQHGVPAVEM